MSNNIYCFTSGLRLSLPFQNNWKQYQTMIHRFTHSRIHRRNLTTTTSPQKDSCRRLMDVSLILICLLKLIASSCNVRTATRTPLMLCLLLWILASQPMMLQRRTSFQLALGCNSTFCLSVLFVKQNRTSLASSASFK